MTRSEGRLAGKVALITGAGQGLGAQMARRFHEEGATVVVTDLHEASAQAVAAEVDGDAAALDVTDSAAVDAVIAAAGARHGRLDVLVNNAGISGYEGRPEEIERQSQVMATQLGDAMAGNPPSAHLDVTVSMTDEEWRRVLAVHLDGTFYCTRAALRFMGPQGSGAIINLGSIMGTSGGASVPAYCAAKAGIMGLTRANARELVSHGIRVNAIAPGWIDTAMTEVLGPLRPMIAAQTPMGRLGDADDVAWAAVYLASDEAKFVTGQVLSPNGGWTMNQ